MDPSVYGYGVQKRPLDDGGLRVSGLHGAQIRDTERIGNQLGALVHQRAVITEDFKVPDKMVGFISAGEVSRSHGFRSSLAAKFKLLQTVAGCLKGPVCSPGRQRALNKQNGYWGRL